MWGGAYWGKTYYSGQYWGPAGATPPPPPPPFEEPPEVGGGGGWVPSQATVLREHLERLVAAEAEDRKERLAAQQELRRMLERAWRTALGLEDPDLIGAFADTLASVVNLDPKLEQIDWNPALKRLDLITQLIGKIETAAFIAEQVRRDRLRDEADLEVILMAIS